VNFSRYNSNITFLLVLKQFSNSSQTFQNLLDPPGQKHFNQEGRLSKRQKPLVLIQTQAQKSYILGKMQISYG